MPSILKSLIVILLFVAGTANAADTPPAGDDPSIDHAFMDLKADPCGNFFRYACGGWIDAYPIPVDQSSWGLEQVLMQQNQQQLRLILEKAVASPTPETQKIGDFYATCMDEAAIEKQGLDPLKSDLDKIAALTEKSQLPALLAGLHRDGVESLFSFGVGQDAKDAASEIAIADQGGLGLPDRDYYLKTDPESVKLRADYVAHVARMFALAGDNETDAAAHAATVMKVETALAKGALDQVSRRDPQLTYHLLKRSELDALTPGFDWTAYFTGIGAPSIDKIDITEEKFFQNAAKLVAATKLEDLKTYLKWHLISDGAAWLPKAFVDENFAFYGKRLTGAAEIKPRWKRCVGAVDDSLGEDLGRAWVADHYSPEAKAGTERMVAAITERLAVTGRRRHPAASAFSSFARRPRGIRHRCRPCRCQPATAPMAERSALSGPRRGHVAEAG